MILGVTLVVMGTLCVVLIVGVRILLVVVVAGVARAVDTSRVVTLSATVAGHGAAVEVVVGSRDQDKGGVVATVVDTSSLSFTGCVVSVIGCASTGLRVVATTAGGVSVEAVVRGVSAVPGAGEGVTIFVVVVAVIFALEISVGVVVLAVVAVAAAVVSEVTTSFDVTGRGGTSVVLVEVSKWMTVSEVTSGVVFTVGL